MTKSIKIKADRDPVIGIDIFGPIGQYPATADAVGQVLTATPTAPVLVRINSQGGDYSQGLAISALLLQHGGPVTTHCISIAASAAAVVFMGGSKRIIDPAAVLMVHQSSVDTYGQGATDLRGLADALDTIDQGMVTLFAERTGLKAPRVQALLAAETWMSSDEAVDLGFATERGTSEARVAASGDLSRIPDRFKNSLIVKDHVMDPRKLLGLDPTATDEQVEAKLKELIAKPAVNQETAPKAEAPKADKTEPSVAELVAEAVSQAFAAREAAAALAEPQVSQQELHASACAQAVERFIADGKITPGNRGHAIQACGSTANSLSAVVAYWTSAPKIFATATKLSGHSDPATQLLSAIEKTLARAAKMTDAEWVEQRTKVSRS